MTTLIKLPLRSLNAATVQDLLEKYPEAEISVQVHRNKARGPLSKQRFWDMIALLDWNQPEGDDAAIVAPAVRALASGPVRHIFEFADLLSEYLYRLDTQAHAVQLGEEAWKAGRYFSVDNFLYARSCVVANGKEKYHQVLKNPTLMPKDMTFEALLYVPSEAYELKMSKQYSYSPAFLIETYSNKAGWNEIFIADAKSVR
jgi:Protein of unknown function (DUF4240)